RTAKHRDVRLRVVRAVTGYHYIVVGHLLRSFTQHRNPNAAIPLGPLVNLIVHCAASRGSIRIAPGHRDRQLRALCWTFVYGFMNEELQPWSSIADRWEGRLCEEMMTQILKTVPRPSAGDSFSADKSWLLIVDQGI